MDSSFLEQSSSGTNRSSPRRPLQGPRPAPLRVAKDSHKVTKKPPVAPHRPAAAAAAARPAPPPRAPLIIYDASPKIIHTKPADFMALVQRLTGPNSTADADADAAAAADAFMMPSSSGAMSPAARLATIERSVRPLHHHAAAAPNYNFVGGGLAEEIPSVDGIVDLVTPAPPGILSPLPQFLPPPVSPGFFSPLPIDPSCFSMLNDLSPLFSAGPFPAPGTANPSSGVGVGAAAARSGTFDPFMTMSPRNQLLTPMIPSPNTLMYLLRSFPEL